MARERTLKVIIAGDADKLDHELKRAGGSLDKFGKQTRLTASVTGRGFSAMRVGASGLAAGLGGLAAGGAYLVKQFEESQKVSKQTAAVLKSTGGVARVTAKDVGDLATVLSRKSGIDDEVVQSGENMLLTFTNIRNEVGKGNDIFTQATSTVLDMSVALGQDTKNSAIQLGKALNDPVKGVTALQRVGVTFTAQQKDQIKALVDSGHAMDAQKLILRELNKEFGGSAAAQATPFDRLKVSLGNLAETAGGVLAPEAEKGAKALDTFVTGMQDGTGQGGRFVHTLKNIWSEAKPIVTWIGRATKNVAEFTADHPGLAKLVAGIVAVGAAVKTLRFVSAATGFSTLLKAGGVAAKGLKRILTRGGAAAGEAAAASAAEGLADHMPASLSARGGRLRGIFGKAGRGVGLAFGVAAAVEISNAIGNALEDALNIKPKHNTSFITGGNPLKQAAGAVKSLLGHGSLQSVFGLGRSTGGVIPGTGSGTPSQRC